MSNKLFKQAMHYLASQPNAVFLGQNVVYDGNVMFNHLEEIPSSQRMELPVVEELQTGIALGLSLQGYLPISIYPRMDFLLRAMDQLVNHLDKLAVMTQGQFKPKVIIRTRVGAKTPLDAGPQHTQNHTEAFRLMLKHVKVLRIIVPEGILPAYEEAVRLEGSVIVVEQLC